jgi:nitrogen-specific signal transduction histidine kinase
VRTQYKDVETEYSTRKKSIAGAVAGAEAERVKIEQELKVNRDALNSEESNYHLLSSLRCMNEARAMLAEQERKFQLGQGRLSNQFRTFQEHLEAAIRQQEESAKEFRKQQRKVQDSHAQHVQQRSKFKALSSLLQLKAQSLQRRAQQEQEQRREAEAQLAAGFGVGAASSLVDAVGGGDGGAAQTMSFE